MSSASTLPTRSGRLMPQAEAMLRLAVAENPEAPGPLVQLAEYLRASGQAEAALDVTAPHVARHPADHSLLVAHAENLKALSRKNEALNAYRRAASEHPWSAVAAHNLAAQLGDMSCFRDARIQAERALRSGLDAPETWMVLARALQGCNLLDESRHAYEAALQRAPLNAETHRELAQLIWMCDGDLAAALHPLDRALAGRPDPRLAETRAMIRKWAGDVDGALADIRHIVRTFPEDAHIRVTAAHLETACGAPGEGLAHARTAVNLLPNSFWTLSALCEAWLGAGEARRAEDLAIRLHAEAPHNQMVLAFLATAWRLGGDERYHEIYDYDAFVSASYLDTPSGWSSLQAYLADLAAALRTAHGFKAHPFSQSINGGSQVSNIADSLDPAIQAFFKAAAGPIHRYLESLGRSADPFRSRKTSAVEVQGAWSVRLRAGRGCHVDHVHQEGWISSACYIALPDTVAKGTEGWLRFGQPGVPTQPRLAAERDLRPSPGLLVLFPSYMWHGTQPFSGSGERLTIAFDLVPVRG